MDIKKINCDGCGQPLDDDDIVTCPVCGTPQHRKCYDSIGGCVNESKHSLGFEWSPPESASAEPDAENIEQANQADRETTADRAVKESLAQGEIPDIDDIIEQRVNAICPGITQQQRKELLCNFELADVAAFVGNGAPRYVNKFRLKERYRRNTFNWAAFLFAPYWFFYRRLYKPGIIFGTSFLCIELIMAYFSRALEPFVSIMQGADVINMTEQQLSEMFTKSVPISICMLVLLVLHIICGVFGDRIYKRYVTNSLIEFGFIKMQGDNENAVRYYLSKSSTSVLFTVISVFVLEFLPTIILSFIS